MNKLCAVLTLLVLFACESTPPKSWVRAEVPLSSSMRLWEISRMAMEREGFPVMRQGFDPRSGLALSGWRRDLHPFKGHGYRERVEVSYKGGEQPGRMVLMVRVAQEINDNVAKPLDLEYAEWVPGPDNQERARVMLQYMRSMLGVQFEVGRKVKQGAPAEKEYGSWEDRQP